MSVEVARDNSIDTCWACKHPRKSHGVKGTWCSYSIHCECQQFVQWKPVSEGSGPEFLAFKARYHRGANGLHTKTPLGFYADGWKDGQEALVTARDQRIAALETALSWYADPNNYEDGAPGTRKNHPPYSRCGGCDDGFYQDVGERARAALAAAGPAARDAEGADPHLPPMESYPVTIEITEVRQGEPFSAPPARPGEQETDPT